MKTVYTLNGFITQIPRLLFFTCLAFLSSFVYSNPIPDDIEIAPSLDNIETSDLVYAEGSGRIRITNTLNVEDVDSKTIRSASVRITNGYNLFEDVLRFSNQNRISGNWNALTGILTLTGSASLSDYETALRSIQYENTNKINPSSSQRTVTFRISDGLSNSNTVSRNITIVAINKSPVLSHLESVPLEYCMNSGAVPVTSSIDINDPDNPTLASATIQIITTYNLQEELLFTNQEGITGTWDAAGKKLTLTGNAPISSYQAAIRSIRYESTNSINPVLNNHDLTITVNDGNSSSNTVKRAIEINGRISVVLTGTAGICKDVSPTTPLLVSFTGRSPWTFSLVRDNENEVIYKNITQNPFTVEVNKEGIYRVIAVSDGYCQGDTIGSGYARITINTAPTAVLSGNDTICAGDSAQIQITLTGTAPWSVTLVNGQNRTTINDIRNSPYVARVSAAGVYSLADVQDANCKGKVSGTASVSQYVTPTAVISGNATICKNLSADLSVSLTGTAPWDFSYKRNTDAPVRVQNVIQSPELISVNLAGAYTLTTLRDRHCTGTVTGSAVIIQSPTPEVSISGLDPLYNKEYEQLVPITGSPAGGTFSGPGLFFSEPNWYFLPRYAPLGILNIVYAYQDSPDGCFGYDTAVVRVLEADAIIEFPENRINFCQNEPSFIIRGINLSNSTGSFSISEGAGLVDNGDNTATIIPTQLEIKEYDIVYTYFDGLPLTISERIEIRTPPEANFQWETECYIPEQMIKFRNTSSTSFGNISGSVWKIHNTDRIDSIFSRDIEYSFGQVGNYKIDLRIRTSNGCIGTVSKTFGLKPIIRLDQEVYSEDFEDSTPFWHSSAGSLNPINNWTLGTPVRGFIGASSGDNSWYTDIPPSASPREQSYMISPCFDFRGTDRPMLKLDIWRLFDSNRDGANLQYSVDSGKTWTLLGQIGNGINWFNNYNILGIPGGSPIGWSSNSDGIGNDTSWVQARHSLEMLIGKKSVQFRIAYGSDGTAQNNYGIAFDNIYIGKQNRIALMEHFTNSSDNKSREADILLNNMVNSDSLNIIDLQYHTSFPGEDPFNEQEPYAPGVRVLYYGLPQVPYSILNGGSVPKNRFDYLVRPLDSDIVHVESLLDSRFGININSSQDASTLNILTDVFAHENLPASEYTIHVAVIERKITGITGNNGETAFESVVKALLPDAAGTTVTKEWTTGEKFSVASSWPMQNVYNPGELRIVSFIQDESTGQVYQAAISPLGIGTSEHEISAGSYLDYFVYPNPASDKVFVRFEKPVATDVSIELFNNLGSLVYTGNLVKGELEKEISTGSYPDGLYILRATTLHEVLGTKKLTITR